MKMKNKCYLVVSLVFLTGLMTILGVLLTKDALAADPVTLEVYDPTGATKISDLPAPRLDTLAGKTICELAVGGAWQFERTFPLIRELLQRKYPSAKTIPYTEFPVGTDMPDKKTLDLIKAKGCSAVIIGNAG
jgi:hypothetical protein